MIPKLGTLKTISMIYVRMRGPGSALKGTVVYWYRQPTIVTVDNTYKKLAGISMDYLPPGKDGYIQVQGQSI